LFFFYDTDKDKMLKEGKQCGGDGGSNFDDARDLNLTTTGVDRHRCVSIEVVTTNLLQSVSITARLVTNIIMSVNIVDVTEAKWNH
jgi:hypothetical protein